MQCTDHAKTAHEQIMIFAFLWSLGAFLEDHDRHRLQTYMTKQTKLSMPKLSEEAPSIFDYNVNPHTGKWFHWDTMIKVSSSQTRGSDGGKDTHKCIIYVRVRTYPQNYVPPEVTPQNFSQLLIPNVSSIRTEFLIDLAVKCVH